MTQHDDPTDVPALVSALAAAAERPAPTAGAAAARRTAGRRRTARAAGLGAAAVGLVAALPMALALVGERSVEVPLATSPEVAATASESTAATSPSTSGSASDRDSAPSAGPTATNHEGTDGDNAAGEATARGTSADASPTGETASGAAGSGPAFSANTLPDTGSGVPGEAVLTAVRFGRHQGYDRVVIEFAGPGVPAWTAAYADGSTAPGGELLSVTLVGVSDPAIEPTGGWPGGETPALFVGSLRATSTVVVMAADVTPPVEGRQQVLVELGQQEPFRVFSLENPSRVVLDVLHPTN